MKQLLLTIAAVVLVGCVPKKLQKTKAIPIQQAEPPTTKAPEISIHAAAHQGNIEAVKKHLAAGTDVNVKNSRKVTPLHIAAVNGHKEIAELLITAGADVNTKGGNGWTPLHIASAYGLKDVAVLLIAEGSEVNTKAGDIGGTPLHQAALYGHKEIFELLIAKGADVNAKDNDGETPLDFADKPEIADLIRKHGGKTDKELKAEGK